ncbi:MAG: pseudouridine-5'-phosphate glycosidase [Planctomycetota bacterium]
MPPAPITDRSKPNSVALETTLLVHGIPRDVVHDVAMQLFEAVASAGAHPTLVGVVAGQPTVGMTSEELQTMLREASVEKVNRANLGVAMARGRWGATTVSTTIELSHAAGVEVFATGGIGGVHRDYATHLDISADLGAIAAHPVAVVTSGCKNILDVRATREALETLGVPVVGYKTDTFPAFYQRSSGIAIDATFDSEHELAAFIKFELARSGRGVVVCNPIPTDAEIPLDTWNTWLRTALRRVSGRGRDSTPALLAAVHEVSAGATVTANIALARSNAVIAGRIAASMRRT